MLVQYTACEPFASVVPLEDACTNRKIATAWLENFVAPAAAVAGAPLLWLAMLPQRLATHANLACVANHNSLSVTQFTSACLRILLCLRSSPQQLGTPKLTMCTCI